MDYGGHNKNVNNEVNVNANYNYNEEEDDININLISDKTLYAEASINVIQSMLLIFKLLIHHNLSMTCIEDIIRVINSHCLQQALINNSLFKFKKFFNLENDIVNKHFISTTCDRELESVNYNCLLCQGTKNL